MTSGKRKISFLLCLRVSQSLAHPPTLPGKQERTPVATNRQTELLLLIVEKSITEKSFVKANSLAALIYIFIKFD